MQAALNRSQRGSFVKQKLYLLWPDSRAILEELAGRLGNEVALPGEPLPLLTASLSEGVEDFYRLKGRYDSSTWDLSVFLLFFRGVFTRASEVFGCRVSAGGACWEVENVPFLPWRQENPGGLEVSRLPEEPPDDRALRLCRLVLGGSGYPRTWAVEQLLGLLGENKDGR